MAIDVSRLVASVEKNTRADQAASVLLTDIAAKLRELSTSGEDMAALQAQINSFADQIDGSNDALSAAVVANTPSAPPAEPEVPVAAAE